MQLPAPAAMQHLLGYLIPVMVEPTIQMVANALGTNTILMLTQSVTVMSVVHLPILMHHTIQKHAIVQLQQRYSVLVTGQTQMMKMDVNVQAQSS